MKLLSVNASLPQEIPYRGGTLRTGIYKQPVRGRVWLHRLNLEGDGQADLEAHGGMDKAVYAYPFEHYATWSHELDRQDFAFGQFGENFTTEGLLEDAVYIGDVYRIGSALAEVSQPRAPCYKLAHKMGLPDFVKTFTASERAGFYLRVLEEGEVEAGDSIERIRTGPEKISVRQVFHALFADADTETASRAVQLLALAESWRDALQRFVLDKQQT